MSAKNIRDLMVTIDMYPQVGKNASVYEAMMVLEKYQESRPPGRQKYRAVLVVDEAGKIIGKIGQLAFLKAFEPGYRPEGKFEELEIAGVSDDNISTMMDSMRLVMPDFADLKPRAKATPVTSVMRTVTEGIDIDSGMAEAIQLLVRYQTLSLLVKENGKIVGLLRLSDLLDEITRELMEE